MYRTSDYRRRARAKAINSKKRKAAINDWTVPYEGMLSKGKIHCSCPLCSAKTGKDGGHSSNMYALKPKQVKIAIQDAKEQLQELYAKAS